MFCNRLNGKCLLNRTCKFICFCFFLMVLFGCREPDSQFIGSVPEIERGDSSLLTVRNFHNIKEFILKYGDKETYCNMYNNNPHYEFEEFHVYLHPDIGQLNINCDPEKSDFDDIVVRTSNPVYRSCHIKLAGNQKDRLQIRWPYVQMSSETLKNRAEGYFYKMLTEMDGQRKY